jgi:hypothetical protein
MDGDFQDEVRMVLDHCGHFLCGTYRVSRVGAGQTGKWKEGRSGGGAGISDGALAGRRVRGRIGGNGLLRICSQCEGSGARVQHGSGKSLSSLQETATVTSGAGLTISRELPRPGLFSDRMGR